MMMKNYYLVLGVPRDEEDPRGIRDAYRQLAKQYHPDRAGPEGATAFRDVVEAYEVLSHDERRALHDQGLRRAEGRLDVAPDSIVLADDVPPEPLAPVPVSIPRGFRHVGPSPEELLDRVLHNLLTARASKAERLQALDAELVLSAAEVERGGVVRLGVPVFRTCPRCGGTGGDWLYPCSTCDHRGVVETEVPVRVHIPLRVWDGTMLELPLRDVGIYNLHVRLHLRIDPLL
jgi:DnaJ-class molecular chaperone